MRRLTATLITVSLLSSAWAAPARAASVTISSAATATAARDHLRGFLDGKTITVRRITRDRYGRTVGELYADGTNVQQAMVASGHARIFWKYAHQCAWTR